MTKRDYHEMSRKEVRKEYLDKVDEVYLQEKGTRKGFFYEIDAMYHTILAAFKNLADDARHSSTDSKGNYHKFGTMERYERDKATERMQERTAKNRTHILRGTGKGLEKTAATVAILSFIGATFFISASITRNAVAELSNETVSWGEIILFIVTIIAGFFLLKRKNKTSKKKTRHK